MSINPIKKLEVWRTFSDASRSRVGTLAQNKQGVFFQY
jgi:serine/threonine-protein kinase HipA